MNFVVYSHRYGFEIVNSNESLHDLYLEILNIISGTTDEEIINHFEMYNGGSKSISKSINKIFDEKFKSCGWKPQSYIFKDNEYRQKKNDNWRLDFAKKDFSIEVAFNHGGSIAWNLIKPVLASELNHIEKDIQTKIGVIICATEKMKKTGGFDGAIGTYENFISYSKALTTILTTPLIIIGLDAPDTFEIKHKNHGNKKIGYVNKLENEPN